MAAGFIYEKPVSESPIGRQVSPGVQTGFAENFEAARAATVATELSISRHANTADAYDAIVEALNEGVPRDQQVAHPFRRAIADAEFGAVSRSRETPDQLEAMLWDRLAARRAEDPAFGEGLPKDRDALYAGIKAHILKQQAELGDVRARSGTAGDIGAFAGGVVASMADPVNTTAMLLGYGPAQSILRTAITEAAIGVGAEAVIQPFVADYRKSLGLTYTTEDYLQNLAYAGAGGFLLGGGIAAVGKALPHAAPALTDAASATGRQVGKVFDRVVKNPTAEQRGAREAFETHLAAEEANPLADTGQGRTEHVARLAEAVDAAETASPVRLAPKPATVLRLPSDIDIANAEGLPHVFDPETIGTDAKTFQFKSEGDAFGVTDRLEGVTKWDPVKAGQVIVFEFEDGGRFIVDGHQRLALARRIRAMDPEQRPLLVGQLLREADGVTPADARAIAAAKNIAEGTGSPIDAAKVLRVSPERIGELPMRSGLVRVARDLVNLSDENFGYVVNELVQPGHAAIVGRLAPDDELMQRAILDVLQKTEPENIVQAEAIVRQALAAGLAKGGGRETQLGLFGEEALAKSLFTERAKVLDLALKRLKRERGVFAVLNRNADRIEAEGNRLDVEANRRREETDAQATQTLQILANRKGPLSDALSAAATRAFQERRFTNAVRDFTDAVRAAVQRGDFEGADIAGRADGGPGGRGDAAAEGDGASGGRLPAEVEQRELEAFDTPAGDAQQRQAAVLERDLRDEIQPDTSDGQTPLYRLKPEEIAAQIEEAQLSDHAKLVRALGSEEAAAEFNRLDRRRNSSNPTIADEASQAFDEKFGNLTPDQERLVYGSIEDKAPTADELQEILQAHQDVAAFADAPDVELARFVAYHMGRASAEDIQRLFATGEGSSTVQAAAVAIEGGVRALQARGLAGDALNETILNGMIARGLNVEDAAFLVDSFLRGVSERQASEGMPSSALSRSEAGGADRSSSPSTAPLLGTQARVGSSQTTTREPPSGLSSSRATSPLTLRGSDIEVGRIGPSNRKIYHAIPDFKDLRQAAADYQPRLEASLTAIADEVPGLHVYGARLKKDAALQSKLTAGRQPYEISDYVGGRLVADDWSAIEGAIDGLAAAGRVIEVDDFIDTPKGPGYRAVHVQLLDDSGVSAEIQIQPREIRAVQDEAHKAYKKFRRRDDFTPEETQEMIQAEQRNRDLFDGAWSEWLARNGPRTPDPEGRIPVGERVDPDSGRTVAETRSGQDVLDEIEQDAAFTEQLDLCGGRHSGGDT